MWTLTMLLSLSLPSTCICKIQTEIRNHTECWSLMNVGKAHAIIKRYYRNTLLVLSELHHWSKNRIRCVLACAAEFMVQHIVPQLRWSYNMLQLLGVCVLIAFMQHFITHQRQPFLVHELQSMLCTWYIVLNFSSLVSPSKFEINTNKSLCSTW